MACYLVSRFFWGWVVAAPGIERRGRAMVRVRLVFFGALEGKRAQTKTMRPSLAAAAARTTWGRVARNMWSQLWREPPPPMPLGRWRYDADPLKRAEHATRDCCGDDLCGTPAAFAAKGSPARAPPRL